MTNLKKCLLITIIFSFVLSASVDRYLKEPIPKITDPAGRIIVKIESGDSKGLQKAIRGLKTNTTILIADGNYKIIDGHNGTHGLNIKADNVTIRSESGNAKKVIIRGANGFSSAINVDEEMFIINSDNVTIANITFFDSRCHAIKLNATKGLKNTLLHNIRFIDIGERSIKGVRSREGSIESQSSNKDGVIEYCYFEQKTKIKYDRPGHHFHGNYIAGMDCMGLNNYRIHHNVFKNIKGSTGGARGAVFIWSRSKDVVVENNIFINCDRSIALGNPSGGVDVTNGIVRNNFIVAGVGRTLEICYSTNIKIYNNTIYSKYKTAKDQAFEQTVFSLGTKNMSVTNNIIMGNVYVAENGTMPDTSGNIHNAKKEWFENVNMGNLNLKKAYKKLTLMR